jgi:hypothetical protein
LPRTWDKAGKLNACKRLHYDRYTSSDIYRAVLEKNITGIEEFKHYLQSITT